MSKKNDTPAVDGSLVSPEQQPAFMKELLETGTTILTAKTSDELAKMVNNIPADVHYGAGAVGFNHETATYSLRLDITSK